MSSNFEIVSLRSWIKNAFQSEPNGNGSSIAPSAAYLQASLKIAISLADQVVQYEKSGRCLVRGDADWAGCTTVSLNDASSYRKFSIESDEDKELKELFADENEGNSTDLCRQFEAFVERFNVNEIDNAGPSNQQQQEEVAPANDVRNAYFNVQSAAMNHPDSDPDSSIVDSSQDKLRIMYGLALLFVELFTGGQMPLIELRNLGRCDGAFISLPTWALVKEDNDREQDESIAHKRSQGTGKSGICKLSLNCMKLLGIPGPLSSLMFNMLDCVHGDVSTDECYTSMTDVKSDLQLMMDNPKFLRGLTVDAMASPSDQLTKLAIPREKEYEAIQTSYRRSMAGACELTVVKGQSGSGKSYLLRQVGCSIVTEGGMFLMAKFDQLQQSRPFSALAASLDEYCEMLICRMGSAWANVVIDNLVSALGQDAIYLIAIIPKLGRILKDNVHSASPDLGDDCGNAVHRLHYLICRFVDVAAMTSEVSLTLCLDDIQWADDASIAVLSRLLSKARNEFFFLACCRDDEMKSDHPFWDILVNIDDSEINVSTVEVSGVEEDTLNNAMSDLMCLSPRLVKPLTSIVHSRSKGNFLFLHQLLLSFLRDGRLHVDLVNKRWVWDEEKIYAAKLPDNIAIFATQGIQKLPMEVRLAIHAISMFGSSVPSKYIEALESNLDMILSAPLKVAIEEGLVTYARKSYTFSHDRIQEASYAMIQNHDRISNHHVFGRCLAKLALKTNDDDMLFTAVNQINFAGPSAISSHEEYFVMAEYNLIAGKEAMKKADFHSAYSLFDNGITFLRKDHWRLHYQFSLEIFELAARCALVSGHVKELDILTSQVLKNAKSFEDQINTHLAIISANELSMSELPMALEKGLNILKLLGEKLPSNPSPELLDRRFEFTKSITMDIPKEIFLSYREATDPPKLALFKLLSKISNIAFFVNESLNSWVVLKMVEITVSSGIAPESSIAFAAFGSLLAKRGEIELATYYTGLAKSFLERGGKEKAGEVLLMICEVACFVEPFQAANELHLEAEAASFSSGNPHCACYNKLLYCISMFFSGVGLQQVDDKVGNACLFMKDSLHRNSLSILMPMKFTISLLMEGDVATESRELFLQNAMGTSNIRMNMVITFHNLFLEFMCFKQKLNLNEYCEEFYNQQSKSGLVVFYETSHSFIAGLASYRLYRETNGTLKWYERGRNCLDEMKLYENQGGLWNFQHKVYLCAAEDSYCLGDFDNAKEYYRKAIDASKAHKFFNELAICHELAARFYFEIGDPQTALEHFTLAHKAYGVWGAAGKANQIFEYINEKFTGLLPVGT